MSVETTVKISDLAEYGKVLKIGGLGISQVKFDWTHWFTILDK